MPRSQHFNLQYTIIFLDSLFMAFHSLQGRKMLQGAVEMDVNQVLTAQE